MRFSSRILDAGATAPLFGVLPLPLAQLYRRAHNAKTALERHLAAFYLWEAALKLLASTAIVEYADSAAADPAITEKLQNLARPALGHWWSFARLLIPTLADRGLEPFQKLRDVLFGKARDDCPRAAGLDALLREALEGKGGARATVRIGELFDRLIAFRSVELGHGAAGQRPAQFYERMGPALLAGLTEMLGRVDVLAGHRLIHVADVRRLASGNWLVERYALHGESAQRLESQEVAEADTARLPRPGRLYLHPADELPGAQLHPLVLCDAETARSFFSTPAVAKSGPITFATPPARSSTGTISARSSASCWRRSWAARSIRRPWKPGPSAARPRSRRPRRPQRRRRRSASLS